MHWNEYIGEIYKFTSTKQLWKDVTHFKISCVYSILNKNNGKMYIGSTNCFKKRMEAHYRELEAGSHHCSHFQNAWNKYGKESFIPFPIEYCSVEKLLEKEKYWIDVFYNKNILYNISTDPTRVFDWTGRKHSVTTKEKMSKSAIGNRITKLTTEQVIEIKKLLSENKLSQAEISRLFNVSTSTIHKIKRGKKWSYIN